MNISSVGCIVQRRLPILQVAKMGCTMFSKLEVLRHARIFARGPTTHRVCCIDVNGWGVQQHSENFLVTPIDRIVDRTATALHQLRGFGHEFTAIRVRSGNRPPSPTYISSELVVMFRTAWAGLRVPAGNQYVAAIDIRSRVPHECA